MAEKRAAPRQKSLLQGRVYFNKGRSAVDCLVRDMSTRGARLIFSDTVAVPSAFDLFLPQKELTVGARVVWRRGDELGVTLTGPVHAAEAVRQAELNLATRLKKLETELAALRRTVRQLQAAMPGHEIDLP
jgi:hypothetical protein